MNDPVDLPDQIVSSIRCGDIAALERIIAAHPGAAAAPVGGRHGDRTPLHVVTDWPGYWPNGPATVRLLTEAGADVDAGKPDAETPLHWAASSDDAEVAAALIDAGADVDAPNGSIGTPLANAVGYGCWDVARLLVARGATVDAPWVAAALGLRPRLEELLGPAPPAEQLAQAFWHACAGGQRRAAEYLLGLGADLHWSPEYAHGTALDAVSGLGTQRDNLVGWLRDHGARGADDAQSAAEAT